MAIFGSLHDMPLPSLLPILGRRWGVLELFNLPSYPPVSLWLDQNQLVYLMVEGRCVERAEAQRVLGELLVLTQGDYEFVGALRPPPNAPPLNWSIDRVVAMKPLSAIASLASSDTTGQQWLQDQLQQFLQAASPLLRKGAGSREIANHLGLPLDQVRYYLHKLRTQGTVKPVRGIWERLNPRGLAARVLAALVVLRKRS